MSECVAEAEVVADVEHSESNVKPNFVYVNPTDEDTMVVQHILSVRMGTREIESSDEDDEDDEDEKEKSEKGKESNEKKDPQSGETKNEAETESSAETEAIKGEADESKPDSQSKDGESGILFSFFYF